MGDIDPDELRAAEGTGEADQEQRPVAQAGEVARADFDQPLDLRGGQRRRRPHRAGMGPGDARESLADRRVAGRPGAAETAVVRGDRRHPPAQRAAAHRRGERRQPGGDHDRVRRPRGSFKFGLRLPIIVPWTT